MDQPPVDNQTDFAVHPQMLLDKEGEQLVAIVKATFELPPSGGAMELAPEDRARGIRFADVPWGKPEISSVAYPADICLRKPGTDVLLVGRAYPPEGNPVSSFDVHVRVGALSKSLKIYGLRVWQAGGKGLSSARPASQTDLRYDNAWGGFDDSDETKIVEEPRNPVGMGVARDPDSLTHKPAPSIEDPAQPISSFKTRPPPAGVGPIGRHWEPRRKFAGTYDDAWKEQRAPLPPKNFDDRFNLCASPGLIATPPLRSGEPVALLNVVPAGGSTLFDLPSVHVLIGFLVKGREPAIFTPHLDTVLIDVLDVDESNPITVEMVWRAHVPAPRRMSHAQVVVKELEVS